MRRGWWSGVLLLLGGGCTGESAASPELLGVTPAQVLNVADVEISVDGRNFLMRIRFDMSSGQARVYRDFDLTLVRDDARVALHDVTWQSTSALVATLKAGVSPGRWDMELRDPRGRRARLPQALRVDGPECSVTETCPETDPCFSIRCVAHRCVPEPRDKDSDEDGHVDAACPSGDDCDDDAPGVHPGAPEVVADGIDQNCDGFDACYEDLDGDGCGSTAVVTDNDRDCTNGSASEAALVDSCSEAHPHATTCAYGQTACMVCSPSCEPVAGLTTYCGDTVIDDSKGENCDDGNSLTETCAYGKASCTVCDQFCHRAPGVTSYCGDFSTDDAHGEVCDDGNTDDCEGKCLGDCGGEVTLTGCGDGHPCGTEACDDGNTDDCEGPCLGDCSGPSFCGDAVCCAAQGENPTTCDQDCCPDACGACDAGGCCSEACADSCTYNCASGCSCFYDCVGVDACEVGCSGAAACTLDCSEANDCQLACGNVAECKITFVGGVGSLGTECNGSSCEVECVGANNCNVRCTNGATCDIDCTGANNCDETTCEDGAECLLDCSNANNCGFSTCAGGEMTCDDIKTCNRGCP